jgi:hypothetical protein
MTQIAATWIVAVPMPTEIGQWRERNGSLRAPQKDSGAGTPQL